MEIKELQSKLLALNVNEKVEDKNGLSYLSWSWAWTELLKICPDATYEIKKFGDKQLPYVYDEETGYMAFTSMTINGITREMWLPVMDSANKAMLNHSYKYKLKKFNPKLRQWEIIEKEVQPATMFDINKTIMRCLTKNIAMFGLGMYIYAGEDLPEQLEEDTQTATQTATQATTQNKEEVSNVNYRTELINYSKEKKLDLTDIAKKYKLNAKSKDSDFKKAYEEIVKGSSEVENGK